MKSIPSNRLKHENKIKCIDKVKHLRDDTNTKNTITKKLSEHLSSFDESCR